MGDVAAKKDIVLTFDTIFEMLRKEKDREELQELPATFFADFVGYLKEKKDFIQKNRESLFGNEDADKTNKQISNIIRVVRELYNRRERKIIVLAVNKALTGSHLIDTSKLLGEEKCFFEDLTKVLVNYRKELLEKAINTELPALTDSLLQSSKILKEAKDARDAADNAEKPLDAGKSEAQPNTVSAAETTAKQQTGNTMKIRFIEDTPKFIGPDLDIFGPFEKGSEHILDRKISEILINSNKAEEI